ncbi:hypothetical protein [Thermithiobacillus plumbiphilus]|uniref:Uncharacterized protein n=1 Tax=Thermithiobacillus plumbiphilus TaxID=1729899 RepID=A0ABU9D8V5_9PROT
MPKYSRLIAACTVVLLAGCGKADDTPAAAKALGSKPVESPRAVSAEIHHGTGTVNRIDT